MIQLKVTHKNQAPVSLSSFPARLVFEEKPCGDVDNVQTVESGRLDEPELGGIHPEITAVRDSTGAQVGNNLNGENTLLQGEDCDVRMEIAERPDLPEDLIRRLAEDEDYDVRRIIAERPDLPEDLIRELALK